MKEPIIRKLFLAFIQVHILHHAKQEPIYGSWMIEELISHGYEMTAGTMYPILHSMEKEGLIASEKVTVNGKIRKYYSITEKGCEIYKLAKAQIAELSEVPK